MSFKPLGSHTALGTMLDLDHQAPPRDPHTFEFAKRHWSTHSNALEGLGQTILTQPDELTLCLPSTPHQWIYSEVSTLIHPNTHTLEVDLSGPFHLLHPNATLTLSVQKDHTSNLTLEFAKYGNPFAQSPTDINLTQRFQWHNNHLRSWLLSDHGLVAHSQHHVIPTPQQQHRLHISLHHFSGHPPLDHDAVRVSIKGVRMYGA